jgi:hypothetical protein
VALKDIGTFVSRYFVIGFYVPSLIGVVAFTVLVRSDWVPDQLALTDSHNQLVDADLGVHLLRCAILALPIAFALSGIWPHIFRFFRAFPYFGFDVKLPFLQLFGWRKRAAWNRLFLQSLSLDSSVRNAAARKLYERYPRELPDVQQTVFANAVRAREEYAAGRWGFDYSTVWPRVEALLTDQEQALHDEARTNLSFAVNVSLAVLVVGVVRAAGHFSDPLNLIPFAVAYLTFRLLAIEALLAGSERIRASLDLHRLELYEKLGVATFLAFSARERELGKSLSYYLLVGPTDRSEELGRRDWARGGAGK